MLAALVMPNLLPICWAVCWCSPLHLKKQTKLMRVMRRENRARPIQNKLMVKKLMMRMMAQNKMEITCEIQNTIEFNEFVCLLGFLA